MPVVSYLSISDKPPMVGVACAPKGFTCRLALKARAFSLSVLDRSRSDLMSRLATVSGAKVKDKLAEVGLRYRQGTKAKVPVLSDAVANIECSLKSSAKAGDHLVIIARVQRAEASGAFTDSWNFAGYAPILYTGWKGGLTFYPGT